METGARVESAKPSAAASAGLGRGSIQSYFGSKAEATPFDIEVPSKAVQQQQPVVDLTM